MPTTYSHTHRSRIGWKNVIVVPLIQGEQKLKVDFDPMIGGLQTTCQDGLIIHMINVP